MRQRAALEFFDVCASEPDVDEVIALFLETIPQFDFEVGACGAWIGAGAGRLYRFYFNNWPIDWLDLCGAEGLFDNDPMVLETLWRTTPFLWSEVTQARNFTIEEAAVVAAFQAYGWLEVLGVPIHGPANYQGLVTLASRAPISISPVERTLLCAMARAVHERAHASTDFGDAASSAAGLTRCERECMRWVAVGKGDAEIGVILGISAAAAHYYVERAKTKLGKHSRSEAAALMVLAGMI